VWKGLHGRLTGARTCRTIARCGPSSRPPSWSARGDLRAEDALGEALAAVAAGNKPLKAFIHLDPDLGRAAARAVDDSIARGEDPGPLASVPFGVKDLDDSAGMPTAKGSRWYAGGPPKDADSIHVASPT